MARVVYTVVKWYIYAASIALTFHNPWKHRGWQCPMAYGYSGLHGRPTMCKLLGQGNNVPCYMYAQMVSCGPKSTLPAFPIVQLGRLVFTARIPCITHFCLHILLHFQLYSRVGLDLWPDFLALPILYIWLAKRMTTLYHLGQTLLSDQPDPNTSYLSTRRLSSWQESNLLEISLLFSVPASLQNIPTKYNIIVCLWSFAFHKLLKSLCHHAFASPLADRLSQTLLSDQPDPNTSYPFDKKAFFVAKVNNLLNFLIVFYSCISPKYSHQI